MALGNELSTAAVDKNLYISPTGSADKKTCGSLDSPCVIDTALEIAADVRPGTNIGLWLLPGRHVVTKQRHLDADTVIIAAYDNNTSVEPRAVVSRATCPGDPSQSINGAFLDITTSRLLIRDVTFTCFVQQSSIFRLEVDEQEPSISLERVHFYQNLAVSIFSLATMNFSATDCVWQGNIVSPPDQPSSLLRGQLVLTHNSGGPRVFRLHNCSFADNVITTGVSADLVAGAAIYYGRMSTVEESDAGTVNFTISDSIFARNVINVTAPSRDPFSAAPVARGGAIALQSQSEFLLNISQCVFEANQIIFARVLPESVLGAALAVSLTHREARVFISSSSFVDNNGTVGSPQFNGDTAAGQCKGGAVHLEYAFAFVVFRSSYSI